MYVTYARSSRLEAAYRRRLSVPSPARSQVFSAGRETAAATGYAFGLLIDVVHKRGRPWKPRQNSKRLIWKCHLRARSALATLPGRVWIVKSQTEE